MVGRSNGAGRYGRRTRGYGRGRRFLLAGPEADDDQVLVDDARCGQVGGIPRVVVAELLMQVDSAAFPETGDRLSGVRIQRVELVHDAGEHAPLPAVAPPSETAGGRAGRN